MTTNFQRAYDIIAEGIAAEDHPGDITQRLLKQFLLVPDLPKPIIENGEPTWELDGYVEDVTIFEGIVRVGFDRTWMYGVELDLDESEALALALLAAVKYQKERN